MPRLYRDPDARRRAIIMRIVITGSLIIGFLATIGAIALVDWVRA